ncbi:M24 family metallopeptidase [Zhongshania sp.]|jgi:hypothetical protein|uniref:M24 family metallopeptidase n=1 Tax=Zhongshania sp. TaxID=1971902 RepID=UPI001B408D10|nr:M24 family metallopeptidase [Zhongshania sp.]MBQ0797393.1 aminopeptidase P family protein [Zhongshania sp.]
MKIDKFDFDELEGFKTAQSLAYDVVRQVGNELQTGITEREACKRISALLAEHGVTDMFHEPFAWFCSRTAFKDIKKDSDFQATDRSLKKGMAVILDVAPIFDGYACDIAYSFSFGNNPDVEAMQKVLIECRDFILKSVRARKSMRLIYRELDGLIASRGFVNVHRLYPERVLAHRVARFEGSRSQRFLQRYRVMGYGLPVYVWLLGKAALAKIIPSIQSPLWNDGAESDHAPLPGVWAVEPHIATPNYSAGAKWEEILVVTDEEAFWLDDDVPHCQLARKKGWWPVDGGIG